MTPGLRASAMCVDGGVEWRERTMGDIGEPERVQEEVKSFGERSKTSRFESCSSSSRFLAAIQRPISHLSSVTVVCVLLGETATVSAFN